MRLEVEAPDTYGPERRYILELVLGGRLGLDWRLSPRQRRDVRIAPAGEPEPYVIVPDVLFATPPADWLTAAALPARPIAWRDVESRPSQRLPVLYGAPAEPAAVMVPRAGGVELTVDVFGGCFFMLSRYEELVARTRDPHGRFPATASLAHAEGFLGLALVDAYVEVLWSALERLWPRLQRRRDRFRVALTHDVDRPLASIAAGPLTRIRQLGSDALVRRDPGLAARRVGSWAPLRRYEHRLDPYNTFDFLMDVSERHALTSAFYFMATEAPTPQDGPYTLEHPWIQSLLRRINERGHEVGLHGSYHSHLDPGLTAAEFRRLRRAAERQGVEQVCWGGRQHYLRWENPVTWSNWDAAGLDYDSTVAYADRIGFRAGTCHEFPVFHLLERRSLRLRERPLQVMDATLFDYMKLSPDSAFQTVGDVARECRRYGGTLALLWHNSSLPSARQKRWYEKLVSATLESTYA